MTKKSDNEHVFVEITNQTIYNKLLEMDKKFEDIKSRQDKTNGKVRLSMWIATTAMTLIVVVLGIIFKHIGG